ncbi:MAG: regulatory protein RecX [Bacteroidales bacterium]|nr:regulatory protein RecX [Bacteroidales bacterium]
MKSIIKEKALKKAQNLCAKSEKCGYDIKNKLYLLKIDKNDINDIINSLKNDGFIDDKRYAEVYVKEKFNLNSWGKIKIKYMLFQKDINESIINKELEKIPEDKYNETLEHLLEKKYSSLINIDVNKQKQRLLSLGSSRGFESGKVFDVVKKIIDNKKSK